MAKKEDFLQGLLRSGDDFSPCSTDGTSEDEDTAFSPDDARSVQSLISNAWPRTGGDIEVSEVDWNNETKKKVRVLRDDLGQRIGKNRVDIACPGLGSRWENMIPWRRPSSGEVLERSFAAHDPNNGSKYLVL